MNNKNVENSEKESQLKNLSKRNKLITICIGILLIVVIFVLIYFKTDDLRAYNKAKRMIDNQEFYEALQILDSLSGYRNTDELIYECNYQIGISLIEEKKYKNAIEIFTILEDKGYKDSDDKENLCKYEITKQLFNNGDYLLASEYFHSLAEKDYKDSDELYKKSLYELAQKYINENSYSDAIKCLEGLNYNDSEELLNSIQNGEYSLNKFIERYNAMAEILREKQLTSIDNLSIDNIENDKLKTSTGAIISFNESFDEEIDYRYEIKSFMWYKRGWIFVDSDRILADWWCTVAGYNPNNTYEIVGDILTDLADNSGDGMYGSITYGDLFYNTSRTKAELTLSGSTE